MEDPQNFRAHQTLIILCVTVAALIGAVTGAFSATMVSGIVRGSQFFSPVLTGQSLDSREVDREIVELIEEESATIAVVERMTPAVVSIVINARRGDLAPEDYYGGFYFDPFFTPQESLTEEELNELVEIGGGTGFFVSEDGYIVTNRHVVSDESAVYRVVTNDGVELPATVVAIDPFLDVAILDVEGDGYPTVTLGDSDDIQIGQTVIAVGNTLSEFRNTVTKGVISGINRRVVAGNENGEELLERAIQTDAAINPGNSGGPLINLLGEVVGVNTAVSFEGQALGFAIPINDIKKAVRDVETYGRIVRPWLGVRYEMLTPDLAEEFDVPVQEGALLVAGDIGEPAILENSPAQEAGLQENDVIIAVNGEALTLDHPLGPVIAQYYPGDEVALDVVRGSEQREILVSLEEAQL